MRRLNDKDLEQILTEVSTIKIPENPVIRAKNVVMAAVRESASARLNNQQRSTKVLKFSRLLIFKPKHMGLIALIVALMVGGGGTVAAAQNDLPDETLYGVKLASERVAETFAVGGEAKVELGAKFAQRRAEEIAKLRAKAQARAELAGEGEDAEGEDGATEEKPVTDKVTAHIQATAERLEKKITQLGSQIEALKGKNTEGTLKAAANLEARVEIWTDLLEAAQTATSREELKEKLMEVRRDAIELKEDTLAAQEDALTRRASEQGFEASARGRVKAVENKLAALTRQREAILKRGEESGRFFREEFEAQDQYYQEAVRLVGEANAALESGEYAQAWVKANAAFKAMVHFNRPVIDPRLLKPITAADVTIDEATSDKPMSAEEREAARLTEAEKAAIRAEAAAGAEAKRQEVLQNLTGENAEKPEMAPDDADAKLRAEAADRAAQEITRLNSDKLGLVVKEKIRNLALRGDAAMAAGQYSEAARFYSQIVLTVKAALELRVNIQVQ